MSAIKDQIEKAAGKSASELTEMVTKIGEGSFSKGLERIREDGVDDGIRTTINVAKEMIKNSHASDITKGISIGAVIVIGGCTIYKGVKWGIGKYKSRKRKRKRDLEN